MQYTALVIDDEIDIRELIALSLSGIGVDTHTAANLDEARNLLSTYHFDICLTDMRLPDGNGVDFLSYIHSVKPDLPVAVVTAHGNVNAAVEAMKNGAFDFVSKPVDIKLLRQLVLQALKASEQSAMNVTSTEGAAVSDKSAPVQRISQTRELQPDRKRIRDIVGADTLIGDSPIMVDLRETIRKVSKTNAPVWITGESGTGKELIARLIHNNSTRSDKPFIPINCGAIPSELVESELFGHRRGSFTGALTHNEGLFRRANGGTLFFDEVAELPLHMQVKLLRAIQERAVRGVGEADETPVDVRILSASHKDLEELVRQGSFRHDLYYRLNVISVVSPALRDRPQDIAMIANFILKRISNNGTSNESYALASTALEKLEKYHFPGNIRELENVLERAVALADSNELDVDDLNIRHQPFDSIEKSDHNLNTTVSSNTMTGKEQEIDRLSRALQDNQWNRKATARALGMTYRQLRYRISQYGIDR